VLLLTCLEGTEGSRGIGLRLSRLRLGARWASVVNPAPPVALPPVPVMQGAGWVAWPVWKGVEDRRFSGLYWDSNPAPSSP
jgi:hypothetical protein